MQVQTSEQDCNKGKRICGCYRCRKKNWDEIPSFGMKLQELGINYSTSVMPRRVKSSFLYDLPKGILTPLIPISVG
jgi:hypothetical protein